MQAILSAFNLRRASEQTLLFDRPDRRLSQSDAEEELSELPGLRRPSAEQRVQQETPAQQQRQSWQRQQSFTMPKASVVAPARHEVVPLQPLPAVGEHAAKAAAFVFHACDVTRSGSLRKSEFAQALEMMMRQKLVPYLIQYVDAARLDAEFAEAAQGASSCSLQTFSHWFEKFDAYLLNFYPEVGPDPHHRRVQRVTRTRPERDNQYRSSLARVGRGLRSSIGSPVRTTLRRGSRATFANDDGGSRYTPPYIGSPLRGDALIDERKSPPSTDSGSRRRPPIGVQSAPVGELEC